MIIHHTFMNVQNRFVLSARLVLGTRVEIYLPQGRKCISFQILGLLLAKYQVQSANRGALRTQYSLFMYLIYGCYRSI